MAAKGRISPTHRVKKKAPREHVVTTRFTETELGIVLWACAQTGERSASFIARAAVNEGRRLFRSLTVDVSEDEARRIGAELADRVGLTQARHLSNGGGK